MKKNKVGILFLVSMLAIAGIGVSYAGFSDNLTIAGTVHAATVEWSVNEYSGTYVWKVYDEPDEIVVTPDPLYQVLPEDGFLVAFAEARAGGAGEADVVVEFDNIFPCIPFVADVNILYTGTIPAKIWILAYSNLLGLIDDHTDIIITVTRGVVEDIVPIAELEGYQIHPGDSIHVDMLIHLEQDNNLQGLSGSFYLDIGILQWNEAESVGWPAP